MKTIAIVDNSSYGHHLAFGRLFARTVLELNYKVVVLMPDAAEVDRWIKINCPEYYNSFFSDDFVTSQVKHTRWGRFNEAASTFSSWKATAGALKRAESRFHLKIHFVFFAWFDHLLANYLLPQAVDWVFPYPWSGLYFHPRHLRINADVLKEKPGISEIDVVLTAKRCKSIVTHDAGIVETFSRRIRKPVIFFPEIADDTSPDPGYELAQKVREIAGCRTVVGMIGLEKRKGALTLIRLAQKADRQKFFFVFAGAINYNDFTEEEQSEINCFFSSEPENCVIHLEKIDEGGRFNALFCSFDIPFIVYNNFASTSNLVTKAAIFRRFVLATERFIIGEDVRNYRLGLTVEEGNAEQCLAAIDELRKRILTGDPFPEGFEEYKNLQGLDKLSEAFKQVLQNV